MRRPAPKSDTFESELSKLIRKRSKVKHPTANLPPPTGINIGQDPVKTGPSRMEHRPEGKAGGKHQIREGLSHVKAGAAALTPYVLSDLKNLSYSAASKLKAGLTRAAPHIKSGAMFAGKHALNFAKSNPKTTAAVGGGLALAAYLKHRQRNKSGSKKPTFIKKKK